MVGMYPIDYNKLAFYPQKGIQDAFGITPSQLPELKKPQSITGYITKEASKSTMIPEGIPVVIGGGDVQVAAIGMGVTEEQKAALILGTTLCFIIPSGKFLNDDKIRFLSWPSAVPDEYVLESGVGAGFLTVTWFKNELAHHEVELSKKGEKSPEDLLNESVKDVPPGSLGLIMQPYWTPPFHRPEAKGSFVGLTMVHSRAHLYRAILEGFAYEIKAGYDVMLGKSKKPIEEIRVCGGGSRGDVVLSILADIFQLPTVRMEVEESSALGAAICAGAGTGMFSDYREGVKRMAHKKDTFKPNPKNREVYETLYKSYQSLYPRIESLYQETEGILHQEDEFNK
jgi:sugar (pentulose or hexulose) kinase